MTAPYLPEAGDGLVVFPAGRLREPLGYYITYYITTAPYLLEAGDGLVVVPACHLREPLGYYITYYITTVPYLLEAGDGLVVVPACHLRKPLERVPLEVEDAGGQVRLHLKVVEA
eukprot:8390829-Pyramimonas_sp.AAC.1